MLNTAKKSPKQTGKMLETYFLGEQIKLERKQAKMTQSQVAEYLSLSKSAISQFESGISRPSMDTLAKLEQLFGRDFTTGFLEEETINQRRKRKKDNGSLLIRADFEALYVELPFVNRDSYDEFVELRHSKEQTPQETEWVWVSRMEDVDYDDAAVLEIRGNRMLPRYPEKSRYIIRIVEEDKRQYSTGVHLIAFSNGVSLMRRIVANDAVTVQLVSDSSDERIHAFFKDIDYMWKLGEAVYMPAEDL